MTKPKGRTDLKTIRSVVDKINSGVLHGSEIIAMREQLMVRIGGVQGLVHHLVDLLETAELESTKITALGLITKILFPDNKTVGTPEQDYTTEELESIVKEQMQHFSQELDGVPEAEAEAQE